MSLSDAEPALDTMLTVSPANVKIRGRALKASNHTAAIAGMAMAMGFGAATFTGCGVAWADDDSSGSSL